jgi:hypothetical protein
MEIAKPIREANLKAYVSRVSTFWRIGSIGRKTNSNRIGSNPLIDSIRLRQIGL